MKLKKHLPHRHLFSSMLWLMLITTLQGQGLLSGTITDQSDGQFIVKAKVLLQTDEVRLVVKTNEQGTYTIPKPKPGAELIITARGYDKKVVVVSSEKVLDADLTKKSMEEKPGGQDSKIAGLDSVEMGYGKLPGKAISGAIAKIEPDDFNKGLISDPALVLQGKVAGLQVYNRGGDPNVLSLQRIRGLTTVEGNLNPLVVIDGVPGASLENIDPNDIQSITVLKDGSAAANYGMLASGGVFLIDSKSGAAAKDIFNVSYQGQLGLSNAYSGIEHMTAEEFVQAGGSNFQSSVDWVKEVSRNSLSSIHNLAISGNKNKTSYRLSGNYRGLNGVLKNSGFDRLNSRLKFSTIVAEDKLTIDINASFTHNNQMLGFPEAFRYAIIHNPTAPIRLDNDQYNGEQYGGYFETLGLFDSFNPVAIVDLNEHNGKRRSLNFGANLGYELMEGLSLNARVAAEDNFFNKRAFYPVTAYYRGNAASPVAKGSANLFDEETSFKFYEGFLKYDKALKKSHFAISGGYLIQQSNYANDYLRISNFRDAKLANINKISEYANWQNIGIVLNDEEKIWDENRAAIFVNSNFLLNDKWFFNASVRREKSSKLGINNQWANFYALGLSLDLRKMWYWKTIDRFALRIGQSLTGNTPREGGWSEPLFRTIVNSSGNLEEDLRRAGNRNLKWERKAETNLGIDFATGRIAASIDIYNRNIRDMILLAYIDAAVYGTHQRYENASAINTKGIEVQLAVDWIKREKANYNMSLLFSKYKSIVKEHYFEVDLLGNPGAPGHGSTTMLRIKEGREFGEFWGLVFEGIDADGGQIYADVNGDGILQVEPDFKYNEDGDYSVLGKAIPDFELGWNHNISLHGWELNAFFRGAFGHSLINSFRLFYEPRSEFTNHWNYINTELVDEQVEFSRYSSLYVENASFFKLDNLTLSRNISFGNLKGIRNFNVSLTAQNLFVITKYTGTDPEPVLADFGSSTNGDTHNRLVGDVLTPGIDRRNNYFPSRSVSLGIKFDF